MKPVCWWWVDMLCRLLEPHEREAVRGDLAEAGTTSGQAIIEVLGLVVRRQAALWKDWRPWLALIGLYPIVALLATAPASLASAFAHYFQRDSNTVVPGLTFLASASSFMLLCLWTGGFVLGSLSRRAVYLTGTLLALFGGWLAYDSHKTVVNLMYWAVLFLLPSSWGVYCGLRRRSLRLRWTILLAAATATTLSVAWNRGWDRSELALFMFLIWPVGYLIVVAGWPYLRRGVVSG